MLTESDALVFGMIALLLVEIVLFIMKVRGKRKILVGLFVVYITLAFSVTLFPIPFQETFSSGYSHNFIPLNSIISSIKAGLKPVLTSVAGNIIITMPFGFLITMMRKNKCFLPTFIFIISFSLLIELLQFVIGIMIGYWYRNIDVDDLILNTVGGVLGWGIYKITPNKLRSILE